MGNENSGTWPSSNAKTTVEQCESVDLVDWLRQGLLEAGMCGSGSWGWREAMTGKVVGHIGNCVDRDRSTYPAHVLARNPRVCG